MSRLLLRELDRVILGSTGPAHPFFPQSHYFLARSTEFGWWFMDTPFPMYFPSNHHPTTVVLVLMSCFGVELLLLLRAVHVAGGDRDFTRDQDLTELERSSSGARPSASSRSRECATRTLHVAALHLFDGFRPGSLKVLHHRVGW